MTKDEARIEMKKYLSGSTSKALVDYLNAFLGEERKRLEVSGLDEFQRIQGRIQSIKTILKEF